MSKEFFLRFYNVDSENEVISCIEQILTTVGKVYPYRLEKLIRSSNPFLPAGNHIEATLEVPSMKEARALHANTEAIKIYTTFLQNKVPTATFVSKQLNDPVYEV